MRNGKKLSKQFDSVKNEMSKRRFTLLILFFTSTLAKSTLNCAEEKEMCEEICIRFDGDDLKCIERFRRCDKICVKFAFSQVESNAKKPPRYQQIKSDCAKKKEICNYICAKFDPTSLQCVQREKRCEDVCVEFDTLMGISQVPSDVEAGSSLEVGEGLAFGHSARRRRPHIVQEVEVEVAGPREVETYVSEGRVEGQQGRQ